VLVSVIAKTAHVKKNVLATADANNSAITKKSSSA